MPREMNRATIRAPNVMLGAAQRAVLRSLVLDARWRQDRRTVKKGEGNRGDQKAR
jgi:hypothetical protein